MQSHFYLTIKISVLKFENSEPVIFKLSKSRCHCIGRLVSDRQQHSLTSSNGHLRMRVQWNHHIQDSVYQQAGPICIALLQYRRASFTRGNIITIIIILLYTSLYKNHHDLTDRSYISGRGRYLIKTECLIFSGKIQ